MVLWRHVDVAVMSHCDFLTVDVKSLRKLLSYSVMSLVITVGNKSVTHLWKWWHFWLFRMGSGGPYFTWTWIYLVFFFRSYLNWYPPSSHVTWSCRNTTESAPPGYLCVYINIYNLFSCRSYFDLHPAGSCDVTMFYSISTRVWSAVFYNWRSFFGLPYFSVNGHRVHISIQYRTE